jgi:hypothetical protein
MLSPNIYIEIVFWQSILCTSLAKGKDLSNDFLQIFRICDLLCSLSE